MAVVQRTHRLSQDRHWMTGSVRRQLGRAARRELGLADVATREEGDLVAVRGTIETAQPIGGVLVEVTGVYRRLIFTAGGTWVHEGASDFWLISDGGGRVLVQVAGARWMVPPRETFSYPAARLDGDDLSREVRERVRAAGSATIEASEQVLEFGTLVQVVGFKTTSADAGGESQGYRLPPQRATLRSGPELPLVITRVTDLA